MKISGMTAPVNQQSKITQRLVCALSTAVLLQLQFLPTGSSAQDVTISPCEADEYRTLDFKLGTYEVVTATGVAAGRARVEVVLDGCLIIEHWQGAEGGNGRAHFHFDADRGQWHLNYINVDGETLALAGSTSDDQIWFTGDADFYGMKGLHRISWMSLADGNVEQVWDLSEDKGTTWMPVFRGLYRRTD